MEIYKIVNRINSKIYIGQTIHTIQQRWKRHCYDALNYRTNTRFAKAIRDFGPESFSVEKIDEANSKEELNQKEKYWIKFYDSIATGYNSTDGGEDTNTYAHKTEEELKEIKEKISRTKQGKLNPRSRAAKCFNVKTNENLRFNTCAECQKYFDEDNHNFITRRCQHKTKYLYKGEWLIAYEEDEYIQDYSTEKVSRKAKRILVKDLYTGEEKEFVSYASAERYFDLPRKTFSGKAYLKGKTFIVKDKYSITTLE